MSFMNQRRNGKQEYFNLSLDISYGTKPTLLFGETLLR
jgi:hypothetical protein